VTATVAAAAPGGGADILLVMVPGMGMTAADFDTEGLNDLVRQTGWPISVAAVDPGADAYLDDTLEARLLEGIAAARRDAGTARIWLAGISLGCQAILRCVRRQPDLAEGLILLTPYLASTGLIAEVDQAGGLLPWSTANQGRQEPERALLTWLATIPPEALPRILVGRALGDRFVRTATMLADLLPADRVISVPGAHDWTSWRALWRLILERNPFEQRTALVF
jgi:pimeloyl-ACP methyl ester carboxylesterase